MKKSWEGTEGEVGETMIWEGNDKAGKGKQTLTGINPSERRIDTQMLFLTPYESEANSSVILAAEGQGTKATWTFDSTIPYPFTIMKLFMDMEKMVGGEFQKGLNRLKAASEKP